MAKAREALATFFVLAFMLGEFTARAEDSGVWPQFRGPNGSGQSTGTHLPDSFGPNENLLWKIAAPKGLSSPVVWGERIFLTAFEDSKLYTLCYDINTGKELWRKQAPAKDIEAYHLAEGSPAASSAAVNGEQVVVYFGSCGLICYDNDGNDLWSVPMPVAKTNNDFGTGVSPIIADGLVILQRDLSENSAIFAFDVKTGKQVWKRDRPHAVTAFSTPTVWKPKGAEAQVVVIGALMLQSYRLTDGEELWTIRKMATVPCTTPILCNDLLIQASWAPGVDSALPAYEDLLKSGDDNKDERLSKQESAATFIKDFFDSNDPNKDGFIDRAEWDATLKFMGSGVNRMIAVKPGAHGDATDTHVVWERTKGLPYVSTALAHNDRIYLIKDGGLISCFNAKTGEPYYEQKRLKATGSYYASPVASENRVYLLSLNGELTTIEAGNELKQISTVSLGERASVTPAIVGNRMIVRTDTQLWAFGSN